MTVTHDQMLFNEEYILAPAPVSRVGFIPALLDSGTSINGSSIYQRITDFDDLPVGASSFASAAFSGADLQRQRPPEAFLVEVDAGMEDEHEDYIEALDKLRSEQFVSAISIDSRDEEVIEEVGKACAARDIIFFWQTDVEEVDDDADKGPFGENNENADELQEIEWTLPAWHDNEEGPYDFFWMCRILAADPDETSRDFSTVLREVDSYDKEISETEYENAVSNGYNLILPFGPHGTYISPGQAMDGRPGSELLSLLWYRQRVKEGLIGLWSQYDDENEKIPVNRTGQELVYQVYEDQFETGVEIGHFEEDQFDGRGDGGSLPEITQSHIDNREIPVDISIQTTTGAVQVGGEVRFHRTPVTEGDD